MIKYTTEQADALDHMLTEDGILLVEAGAGCVDKDTEFLTPTGWKYINQYAPEDMVAQWHPDSSIDFVQPEKYVVYPSDTMNRVTSSAVDMVISDEHRVPYFNDKGYFKTKQFHEICGFNKLRIPRTYTTINSSRTSALTDELIRVLVMQSVDGIYINDTVGYKICVYAKTGCKKERVIQLLTDAGIPFHPAVGMNGFLCVAYYPPTLIAFKGLSSLWGCSTEQLKVVGQEAALWSEENTQRKNTKNLRFTGNKEDADLIQHAWHIYTGCYVTTTLDPSSCKNTPLYTVHASNKSVSDLTFKGKEDKNLASITPYTTVDGYKYCFSMPSTFWLARRNGKVFPTGNTGKSFMSRQIVKELNVKSGIYTAFNKAIVQEGEHRFAGTPIQCKTLHALAYRYVKPEMDIKSFSYKCIKEKITYDEKRRIIDVIDTFFVSSSTCMGEYFEEQFKNHPRAEYMSGIAEKYIQGMADGTANPTFNFLLKSLHLMMVEGTVDIKVDIVILDEINDVTAVSLEIFKLINAPKKLGLGETNQAIYEFLNLVNGFEMLKDTATFKKFSQSYRCSVDVAKRIENKMKTVLNSDFLFKGTDKPTTNGKTLYCTLTNAAIVEQVQKRLKEGRSFTLLRKPSDIFAAPLAVLSASQGKRPFQSKFEYLLDVFEEYKNQSKHKTYFKFLLEELEDEEINNAVKLLQKMSSEGTNIYNVYKECKEIRPDINYTISTVFTSKGLEFENVHIADDLNRRFIRACNGELSETDALTTMRCYYVAASRCGVKLHNALL